MFYKRHGMQPGRAVFAETPLGLVAMEPDSPQRRLKFSGRCGTIEALDEVLSLMRKHQPDSDAQLFWAAAMNGHVDIAQYLVKEGVSVEIRHKGQTPLHTAVLHGQKEVFEFLMKSGADVHALTSDRGMSALHLLFRLPKPVDTELFMLEYLYRKLGDVLGRGSDFGKRVYPIHLAVLNSRIDALARLIDLGADPTVSIGEDIMPSIRGCLRHAGSKPPPEMLELDAVDAHVAYPTQVSIKGLTPAGITLVRYDMFSPTDVVAMLRILVLSESPAATIAPSLQRLYTFPSKQQTIFHLIACDPSLAETDIIPHFLRHLAPLNLDLINLPDAQGDTPLHYAALFTGTMDGRAVNKLLALGANPKSKNAHGVTPAGMLAWHCAWKLRRGDMEREMDRSLEKARGIKREIVRLRERAKGVLRKDSRFRTEEEWEIERWWKGMDIERQGKLEVAREWKNIRPRPWMDDWSWKDKVDEGDEGDEGNEGDEGDEGDEGNEGDEGDERYGGFEGSEGSEGSEGYEGYEGYEGSEGYEGGEDYEGDEGDDDGGGDDDDEWDGVDVGMRLWETMEEEEEDGDDGVVRMVRQLLRGVEVSEVWDLQKEEWTRDEWKVRVKLRTKPFKDW